MGAAVASPCGSNWQAHSLRLRPSAKTAQPSGSNCQGANRLGASISDMYTSVYIYFWPRLILSRELVGLVELDPPYGLHIRRPFLVPV